MLMARMRTGFAVIGDTQFLPGYCVLLYRDPNIEQLTDLGTPDRAAFLLDMTLLGAAVEGACGSNGLRRVNYEILGNVMPALHAHVIPRYEWEPEYNRAREALSYGEDVWFASEHAYSDTKHRELRQAITARLAEQIRTSY
jgi:diadenosine tetraphosphate (Ap4A) HIT family hydrolase